MQTSIEFNIHKIENLACNQDILDSNKYHFSRQCKIVYEAMKKGERLTTSVALIKYGIGDLRARVRDLIKLNKINVKSNLLMGRFKEYYL